MSGKAWAEYLCEQFGINAVELHIAMKKHNRKLSRSDADGRSRVRAGIPETNEKHDTGTLLGFFTKTEREPQRIQLLVKNSIIALRHELLTYGRRSPEWNDEIHSYEAFKSGRTTCIAGPLKIANGEEFSKAQAYNGSYVCFRRNFEKRIVGEGFSMTSFAQAGSGIYRMILTMREGGSGDEIVRFDGYAHKTVASVWGYVSRKSSVGLLECLSLMIPRLNNDNPKRLSGIFLRRSSKQGNVAQRFFAVQVRAGIALPPPTEGQLGHLQQVIDRNLLELKGMPFDEIRSEASMVHDIPADFITEAYNSYAG